MNRLFALLFWLALPVAHYAQFIDSLNIMAQRLHYDQKRQLLYVTVKGDDASYGNSLVAVNPFNGSIVNNVYVGSDPTEMVTTHDGDFLYIALNGSSQVKRINLKTFSVDRTINLGGGNYGPFFGEDLATVPMSNELVIVSRFYTGVSPRHGGVGAYYKGDLLPGVTPGHTGSNAIEGITDSNVVVGINNESTESGFRKMRVDTISGITLVNTKTDMQMGYTIKYDNGLLYSNNGRILDPFPNYPPVVGTCSLGYDFNARDVEPDPSTGRIYFAQVGDGLEVRVYNINTTVLMGTANVRNVFPGWYQSVTDIEHFEGYGLASIVTEQYYGTGQRRLILTYFSPAVGIEEASNREEGVRVYPNPSDALFRITDVKFREVTISDQTGRTLYRHDASAVDQLELDAENLHMPPGIYLVRVQHQGQTPLFKKLVIEGR
jgi:hypothetical protein